MSSKICFDLSGLEIPRAAFGASTLEATTIDLGNGAATIISHETVVQSQISLASLRPGFKVLEVGSGTGYLCAQIARAVGDPGLVYGIEVIPEAVELARGNLDRIGFQRVHLALGDGLQGWPDDICFDRIILSCTVFEFPWRLVRQLSLGGIMVLPIGRGWPIESLMLAVRKQSSEPQLVPIDVSMAIFITARGETPPPLKSFPVPPIIPEYECEMLVPTNEEIDNLHCVTGNWQQDITPVDAEFRGTALYRCATLLAILYPQETCFVRLKGYPGPLGVGLYNWQPVGAAVVTWGQDLRRFGPVYSLGDQGPKELLMQVIERAAAPITTWLDGIERVWSPTHPWREGFRR